MIMSEGQALIILTAFWGGMIGTIGTLIQDCQIASLERKLKELQSRLNGDL